MTHDQPLLTVEHLTMRFGGLVAIDDLSFTAQTGEITAIIGPNGAGKTTVFNCLTGFYKPTVGRLTMMRDGMPWLLEQLEDYRISREAGVARTFQNIRIFPQMSVLENLIVAQHVSLMKASGNSALALFGIGGYRKAERKAVDLARYWLDRVDLTDRADEDAGSLSYGAQRRLEIARRIAAHAQFAVNHRLRIGIGSHLAGPHRVKNCGAEISCSIEQFGIAVKIRAGFPLLRLKRLECFGLHNATGISQTGYGHRLVLWARQIVRTNQGCCFGVLALRCDATATCRP